LQYAPPPKREAEFPWKTQESTASDAPTPPDAAAEASSVVGQVAVGDPEIAFRPVVYSRAIVRRSAGDDEPVENNARGRVDDAVCILAIQRCDRRVGVAFGAQ
jgi:hypothetical protein